MYNIDSLIQRIHATVQSHYLGHGAYARYLTQDSDGSREMGANPYGCADAMNILYTIGAFPTRQARADALCALRDMQDPETGLFRESTHHPIHTTAHCTAAIELFDERPLYPIRALRDCFTEEGMLALLDSLDWSGNPWPQSHQGAGLFVIGVLTGSVDPAWQRRYFRELWDRTDPVTGMSRAGTTVDGTAELFAHLNGWFHYTFNMEYAHMPQRYPDRVIDTCITLYDEHRLGDWFGTTFGFSEIDWVYVLNRATRQTPHRFYEAKERLRHFASAYLPMLDSVNYATHDRASDLHMLFGTVCALAELQAALPGEIESTRPLRLVLDRRPFI